MRTLSLDPATWAALLGFITMWAEERRLLGQSSSLLFVRPDGRPLHPDWITELFHRHSTAAGLPRIRLHDVRHSYASAALKAGVSPKILSERLGHSTVAFTMHTYAHVIPAMDEQIAGTVAALILGGGRNLDGTIPGTTGAIPGGDENWPGTKSQASDGSGGRI